jgi:nitric oxide synthase oxygenase domain/subunit
MSKLSKLYEAQKTFKENGLTFNEEQEAQLRTLEEEIIKNDILPVLTEQIEPALKQVQRELVLVVDYVPGEDLKVHLSRKRNLADALTDAVEIKLDPTVEHKTFGKQKAKKGEIASATRLRVTMPDGKVIAESKAAETLRKVIEQIGAERVRALGLTWCKVPFISNTKDPKYGHAQHPVGNGWYVITHSGTKDKKKVLDKIAKALNLNLKVDIID